VKLQRNVEKDRKTENNEKTMAHSGKSNEETVKKQSRNSENPKKKQ
jgi:hypothetical protein